jgi:ERF superfamily
MCKACVSFSTPYIACIRGGKGRNTSQVLTLDYCEDCSKIKSNLKTMTESLTNYSTNSLTIYQAMAKILADIDFIGKDRKADMGNAGRYNFRGIDDIYNALHSSFAKYKVFIIPKILDSKLEIQEKEKTYNGSTTKSYTYSVILTVEFTFVSEDGSSISAIGIGHALDQSDKATNKAQSSALKYCLMQAFLIPTEESKDVEVENIQAAPTARKKPPDAQEKLEPLPSNDRENRLKELKVGILEMIEALEWSNDEQYKWANKLHGKPSSEWTLQQWSQASVDLQDHIDKAGAAQNLVEAGADY